MNSANIYPDYERFYTFCACDNCPCCGVDYSICTCLADDVSDYGPDPESRDYLAHF